MLGLLVHLPFLACNESDFFPFTPLSYYFCSKLHTHSTTSHNDHSLSLLQELMGRLQFLTTFGNTALEVYPDCHSVHPNHRILITLSSKQYCTKGRKPLIRIAFNLKCSHIHILKSKALAYVSDRGITYISCSIIYRTPTILT